MKFTGVITQKCLRDIERHQGCRAIVAEAETVVALLRPPKFVESVCVPTVPQVVDIVTVIAVPAVAVEMLEGERVTVYPEFCRLAAVIMLETIVVTEELVATDGMAARAPAFAAAWNAFFT